MYTVAALRERGTKFVGAIKARFQEYKSKRENETNADRASRRTANATVWIAAFALISIGVGIFQWRAISDQLIEMHKATVFANRAWVAPHEIRFEGNPEDDAFPLVAVVFENTGVSPALNWNAGLIVSAPKIIMNGDINEYPGPASIWAEVDVETKYCLITKRPYPGTLTLFRGDG